MTYEDAIETLATYRRECDPLVLVSAKAFRSLSLDDRLELLFFLFTDLGTSVKTVLLAQSGSHGERR